MQQQWRVALVSLLALLLGASAQISRENFLKHRNLNLLPLDDCGVDFSSSLYRGNATDPEEFPWTALLRYRNKSSKSLVIGCGGTLISRRYVVTAAHCVTRRDANLVSVRLGEWDLDCENDNNNNTWCPERPMDLGVEEVIPHPDFNHTNRNRYNDIALIRLSSLAPEESSFIKPICLPIGVAAIEGYTPDMKLTVSGWALIYPRAHSPVKMAAMLSVVDRPMCQKDYTPWNINISDTHLCAGGAADRRSCIGDAGGPLMEYEINTKKMVLSGIVSFGPHSCGSIGMPVVFTRVSAYVTWILDNIRP